MSHYLYSIYSIIRFTAHARDALFNALAGDSRGYACALCAIAFFAGRLRDAHAKQIRLALWCYSAQRIQKPILTHRQRIDVRRGHSGALEENRAAERSKATQRTRIVRA